MKSPCYSCELVDADKNGEECLRCNARFEYAELVENNTSYIEYRTSNPQSGHIKRGTNDEVRNTALKKEEIDMANKRGTCVNCERGDLLLPGFGLCWICYDAQRAAKKTGESAEDALAEIKEKTMSGKGAKGKLKSRTSEKPNMEKPNIVHRTSEKQDPRITTYKAAGDIERGEMVCAVVTAGTVCINFNDERDKKIREYIDKEAKEHRRNPDQQIMWILQQYVEVAVQEPEFRSQNSK